MVVIELSLKNPSYNCSKCCYHTQSKKDFNKHLATSKHKLRINGDNSVLKAYQCDICCKIYNSPNGLWYHKKKCGKSQNPKKNPQTEEVTKIKLDMSDKDLIMHLLQQNNNLTQQIVELANKPSISNSNSHNNSHNKQFNIQVFLNETCKNAMTITDFVDSLDIKNDELEDIGKLGYIEGISNIFIRGLKDLDETERPMHCTDKKRETLYIKDVEGWNKDEGKEKVKDMIDLIANKNLKKIPIWQVDNPNSNNRESKKHAEYVQIVNQVMSGILAHTSNDIGINKIIKKVANEVYIDRSEKIL